jgi:hypothetical protein
MRRPLVILETGAYSYVKLVFNPTAALELAKGLTAAAERAEKQKENVWVGLQPGDTKPDKQPEPQ